MDLLSNILKSNEAISNINPVGSYQSSYKTGAETLKTDIENEKARYAQDIQYKLQEAIHNSIDPKTRQPNYDKLAAEGKRLGIDAQTMDYAIDHLVKNWKGYEEATRSKNTVKAISPEGYKQIQEQEQGQNWSEQNTTTQESTLAPATIKQKGQVQIASEMNPRDVGYSSSTSGSNVGYENTYNKYTIPRSGTTTIDENGNPIFKEYTPEEIQANPSLDTRRGAENFFRVRSGDNTSDINTVAQNYLKQVGDAAYKAEAVPNPPVYPVSPTPEAIDKYNASMVEWQNKNEQAIGKAQKAINDVKESVAKGQFDVADKLINDQKLTIKVDGKEYKAHNEKARDQVMYIEALKPVGEELKAQLKVLEEGDFQGLKLLIPVYARYTAGSYNPGMQISEGNIDENKMSTMIDTAEKAGLSVGGAIAVIFQYIEDQKNGKNTTLLQLTKDYISGAIKASSIGGIKSKMVQGIEAAEKAGESFKETGLIGYGKKPKDTPKEIPGQVDKKDNYWYNSPVGSIFKLNPDDENSEQGKVYKTSPPNPVTGETKATQVQLEDGRIYTVNPGDNTSEDVELEPWNEQPTKAKPKPKKKGSGGKGNKGQGEKRTETPAERIRRLSGGR